jgi:peptide/nickel transport system permease protein
LEIYRHALQPNETFFKSSGYLTVKKYILFRLLGFIPVLLGVSIICFSFIHLVPGNIVQIMAGEQALTPEKEAELLAELGLDKPIYIQYLAWLFRVARGDFGVSYATGLPVMDQILQRLPVNIELMIISMIFVAVIGISFGILAAAFQFTGFDYGLRVFAILGYCIPNFWLATMFVLLGSLVFPMLPVLDYVPFSEGPWANIRCMIIPGFVLGLASLAYVLRMTRSSFLEQMRQDYVRTARAKGLTENLVFLRHLMKNALIPVITIIGLQIGSMIGGFVLTEEVFVLPGVGRLLLEGILQRDFNIIQGIILLLSAIFLTVNLLVDIVYAWLDPRIKY